MAVLKIEGFTGIAPKVDPKKLLPGAAQHAVNCVFEAGDLRPLRLGSQAFWTGPTPAFVDHLRQWKFRWLAWAGDVDVVNTPVVGDTWERVYWSRGAGLAPRFATGDVLISATDMTALGTDLGVIPPAMAPSVVPSTVSESSVPAETLAKTNPVRVSTATDHPFGDGDRVIVALTKSPAAGSDVPDTPPDRTGMTEISGGSFVVRAVRSTSGALDLRSFDLIGASGANWSAYEPNKWLATVKRVLTDADMDSRAYVFTLVSRYGEESQPSPPSSVVNVVEDSTVSVSVPVTPSQISDGYRVRLYRSVTGTSGTSFFFVREVQAGPNLTIIDDTIPERLGEMLPSETWTPPPAGLTGLVAMPGGFLAGFVGNTLYFSEPYMPHAWPLQYRRSTQDEIVGLGVYGQTLVVATRGKPYLASGADPASVSLQQLDDQAPCLKRRCLTSTGTGVVFPTQDGLVHVSSAGVRRLTDGYFSRQKWQELVVNARAAAWHNGRYLLASPDVTWLFEPHPQGLHVSRADIGPRAFAITRTDTQGTLPLPPDTLVYADEGSSLVAFDSNPNASEFAEWVGRIETFPRPVSLACGQVFASAYPISIEIHAATIPSADGEPPSLAYPNGTLVHQQSVSGPEPFRLPSGFTARDWRVSIVSLRRVQAVYLATSMDELKTV